VELDAATPTLAEVLRGEPAADEDLLRRSLLRALASQRLHGEVLIGEFHVSPAVVGRALRRQLAARLQALEELADARVCFRVTVRPPRSALQGRPSEGSDAQWIRPLEPCDFLHGRKRARERGAQPQARAAHSTAWQALGLSPGADTPEIKRAYKRLARAVHPDLHPDATDGERRVLAARFNAITEAYRVLTYALNPIHPVGLRWSLRSVLKAEKAISARSSLPPRPTGGSGSMRHCLEGRTRATKASGRQSMRQHQALEG
jgi:DnaJ domain